MFSLPIPRTRADTQRPMSSRQDPNCLKGHMNQIVAIVPKAVKGIGKLTGSVMLRADVGQCWQGKGYDW